MALDGTYSGLISTIRSTIVDDTVTDDVAADLVRMAHAKINRDLSKSRLRPMRGSVSGPVTAGVFSIPSDLIDVSVFSLTAPKVIVLSYIGDETLAELEAGPETQQDPQYYTTTPSGFRIWPIPATAPTARLDYWQRVPEPTSLAPTNWLMTFAPDVYLFAALMQAEAYVKDDQRIAIWGSMYAAALEGVRVAYPEPVSSMKVRTDFPRMQMTQGRIW
jgi:hypothetical protein